MEPGLGLQPSNAGHRSAHDSNSGNCRKLNLGQLRPAVRGDVRTHARESSVRGIRLGIRRERTTACAQGLLQGTRGVAARQRLLGNVGYGRACVTTDKERRQPLPPF